MCGSHQTKNKHKNNLHQFIYLSTTTSDKKGIFDSMINLMYWYHDKSYVSYDSLYLRNHQYMKIVKIKQHGIKVNGSDFTIQVKT